jgi:VanZ family protein
MMKFLIGILEKPYLALIFTLLIFGLCTMPSEHITKDVNDKTAHFVAFAGISFLWLWAFKKAIYAMLLSVFFGGFIEIWQGLLPLDFHRGADFYDFLADTFGVFIGLLLFWLSKSVAKKLSN